MGQGYSLTTLSAASATIDVPELADLVPEKTLASARFMKSMRARNQQGFVFVKAVMKPYPGFDVSPYVKQILHEREVLSSIPNALGYQRLIEVGSGGFLVRQFINNSVYDRLSTRPFLEEIEKKWLAFQLLSAVRDCHAQNIYHGDIKTENLLVTSWNWLYLTDFSSSFKPATLPEDNPADFSFYFDTSGRRTCYLAPERFTVGGELSLQGELNWAMDIFSVGCLIAELFLEGPIFSLSQVFKYKTGDYDPEHSQLDKLEDSDVREMILNMIELDPEKRYSAEQYLSFYRGKIFPEYFSSFLHQYMLDLTDPSAGRRSISLDLASQGDADDKIQRVISDFDKISYFLGYSKGGTTADRTIAQTSLTPASISRKKIHRAEGDSKLYDGTLLFLTIIVSTVRNTSKASARLKACDLMVAFAMRLPDEAKLDRVLPYLADLLHDSSDVVRVAALNAITALLDVVKVVAPINAYIFPEYIFPRLRSFVLYPSHEPSVLLRATYATCLASLALSSARILDMAQAVRADGRIQPEIEADWNPEATYHGLYDVARGELVRHFEEVTKALITDPEASVRRALLKSVASLCVFLGSSRANDVILSHLNTYANDKDWILRCSFYESLVGVATYLGTSSLEQFILPIMIQSLTDTEHFVVEGVFRSMARMAALGLFQRSTIWELVSIAVRFLAHPDLWIRESASHFVARASALASLADRHSIIIPLLKPFVKSTIMDVSENDILDALKPPLPRIVLENAISWARRNPNSAFWEAAARDSVFILPDPEKPNNPMSITKRLPTQIPASQRREDAKALETLRTLGMSLEDEVKLVALREYLLRVSQKNVSVSEGSMHKHLNGIIPLTQIDVTPRNVFFDNDAPLRVVKASKDERRAPNSLEQSRTITDALLEASTTLSERPSRQDFRIAQPNGSSARLSNQTIEAITISRDRSAQSTARTVSDLARGIGKSRGDGTVTSMTPSSGEEFPASDPERITMKRDSSLALKHRGSAMNLMSRKSTLRADAETSMQSENAFAKLDGPLQARRPTEPSPLAMAAERSESLDVPQLRYVPNHDYTGNDPNVLKLLENHFVENFAIDDWDFGPQRTPLDTSSSIRTPTDPVPTSNTDLVAEPQKHHDEAWRPSGHLLALFSEHTAVVNRVLAAPDHAFFVTASDDGTCKVWDTIRLEKNITPRSRHTIRHATGTKVKTICFVQGTHAFISAGDDGSIRVTRIDYRGVDGGESSRYGKPTLIRDWQIPAIVHPKGTANENGDDPESPEHATYLYHFRNQNSQSVLLVATTRHRLLAVDLKNMDILFALDNPIHHGIPTTFVVDRKHQWILLGTTHGILDLWDLRFRLRLRSFGIQTSARIDKLLLHPTKGHGKWTFVSAGGEISLWDIEKCSCREVYRPSSFPQSSADTFKPYEPWYPDEESSERILARFAKDMTENATLVEPSLVPDASISSPTRSPSRRSVQHQPPSAAPAHSSTPDRYPIYPIPALTTYTDSIVSTSSSKPSALPEKPSFLLTGGLDRTLRTWDLQRADQSRIISGPQILSDEQNTLDGRIKAKYIVEHPLNVHSGGLIGVVKEILPGSANETDKASERATSKGKYAAGATPQRSSTPTTPVSQRPAVSRTSTPSTTTTTSAGTSGGGTARNPKPLRSTVIQASARALLRTHMDGIMDVIVLRKPYGLVVSVDRGGCVFVWQ